MKLSGNKILITGASDGIGKAMALKFIELNNTVIAVARNREKLEKICSVSSHFVPYVCDISNPQALDELIVFIQQKHPDINILINNAAIQYNYKFSEEENLLSKIEYEIKLNLLTPIKLTALLLPLLEEKNNAAIVNVSSGLGLAPKASAPVYCGTKAGLHIFTKAFRYQSENVKVFEVIPSLVDTAMTAGRGRGKISPEQLVDEFIRAFKNDKYEINIGKVKLLRFINRISPMMADKLMKNGR